MDTIKLGDIFEIETKKGKGYIQYVQDQEAEGSLVKVFNRLFPQTPENIKDILSVKDFYYIGFILKDAYQMKIVKLIGHASLPWFYCAPRYFRTKNIFGTGWNIVDSKTEKRKVIEQLTEKQKKLSPFGIINDTILIERLEEGWSLKNWN